MALNLSLEDNSAWTVVDNGTADSLLSVSISSGTMTIESSQTGVGVVQGITTEDKGQKVYIPVTQANGRLVLDVLDSNGFQCGYNIHQLSNGQSPTLTGGTTLDYSNHTSSWFSASSIAEMPNGDVWIVYFVTWSEYVSGVVCYPATGFYYRTLINGVLSAPMEFPPVSFSSPTRLKGGSKIAIYRSPKYNLVYAVWTECDYPINYADNLDYIQGDSYISYTANNGTTWSAPHKFLDRTDSRIVTFGGDLSTTSLVLSPGYLQQHTDDKIYVSFILIDADKAHRNAMICEIATSNSGTTFEASNACSWFSVMGSDTHTEWRTYNDVIPAHVWHIDGTNVRLFFNYRTQSRIRTRVAALSGGYGQTWGSHSAHRIATYKGPLVVMPAPTGEGTYIAAWAASIDNSRHSIMVGEFADAGLTTLLWAETLSSKVGTTSFRVGPCCPIITSSGRLLILVNNDCDGADTPIVLMESQDTWAVRKSESTPLSETEGSSVTLSRDIKYNSPSDSVLSLTTAIDSDVALYTSPVLHHNISVGAGYATSSDALLTDSGYFY